MFGDPSWMKWSLRGSTGDSPFSGAHRQVLMSSIASSQGMKWSPNTGLMDRETGELISTNPAEIAQKLLGPTAQADDLESVETIMTKAQQLPNYQEITADARKTIPKMPGGVELPESFEDTQLNRIRELSGLTLNSVRMS